LLCLLQAPNPPWRSSSTPPLSCPAPTSRSPTPLPGVTAWDEFYHCKSHRFECITRY
uniref:Uncharacterized protein n=1 Tax=Cyprinus carpio TaxID=7962 RepID=A0A8C1YJV0_CYPCA